MNSPDIPGFSTIPRRGAQTPAPTPVTLVGDSPLRRWVWVGRLISVLSLALLVLLVLLVLLGGVRLVVTIGRYVSHNRR